MQSRAVRGLGWVLVLGLVAGGAAACEGDGGRGIGGGGDSSGGLCVDGEPCGDGGFCADGACVEPVVKLERLQVVSAAPLVDRGGGPERACRVAPGDPIAGIELGVVLRGTDPRRVCPGGSADRDRSVRPGDRLEGTAVLPGESLTAQAFDLSVDCVEPYPDPDILTTRECQGVASPGFGATGLGFRAFYDPPADERDLPVRCDTPVAVALLIDRSGSTRGFVDPDNGYHERPPGSFLIPGDEERVRVASDPATVLLATAVEFIEQLNANDQLVVFTYRESETGENLQVPCSEEPPPATGALAGEPEYVRQAFNCFGVNRSIIRDAVAQSFGDEGGRTPLWEAVLAAYHFLQREDIGASPIRHIVVLGDGPDTCNGQSVEGVEAGASDSQCSATSYEEVYDEIVAGNAAPGAVPVHVHFVQLQAHGYPERDGRMMELACATEGHYQFVNALDFPRAADGLPGASVGFALRAALSRVRASLLGYWTLQAETAAFDVPPGSAGHLAPGTRFGVAGLLTLKAGDLVLRDALAPFDVAADADAGPWDGRVAFRRTCTEDAQCTAGAVDPCHVYCAVQEGVCVDPPATRPDGAPCTPGEGSVGQCCAGVCQADLCE